MTTIDFTPLYRSSVGFDRFASMLDTAMRGESTPGGYPPYNIEALEDDHYAITIAVAASAVVKPIPVTGISQRRRRRRVL